MQEALKQALNHPGEFNELTLYPYSLDDIEKIYKINVEKHLFYYYIPTGKEIINLCLFG